MLVCERDERRECAVVEPRVRIQQQDVAPGRSCDAGVPTGGEPAIRLLDDLDVGKALADERGCPVVRPRTVSRNTGFPSIVTGTSARSSSLIILLITSTRNRRILAIPVIPRVWWPDVSPDS